MTSPPRPTYRRGRSSTTSRPKRTSCWRTTRPGWNGSPRYWEARDSSEAPWSALRGAFVVVASDYSSQRRELIRRFVIMTDNPSVYARSLQLQAGWEDALADFLADRAGTRANDVMPPLMAAAALACMRSSLRHWLITGHRSQLPALVAECFDHLSEGFGEAS